MSQIGRIRLLPEHLIDQIKAGEVIERPANVLKELVENALDAGATRVDIEIRENGLGLLRVSDNGRGIPAADIELAFGRHATSKIERFEDLYRLDTFGFRGEALPSIASVSRLECVSWRADEAEGASIRFEGGLNLRANSAAKAGQDHGTVMTVKDLFFNTPVRLKFMQSAASEKNWLKRFFYAFALAYPEVSFSIQWDDAEKLIYDAVETHAQRVRQMFSVKAGKEIEIKEGHREWNGLQCRLLLISDGSHRPDGPIEHVLVNRRPVLDKSFLRIAQQILEKYWPGEMPCLLIMLDLPGDQVDVNVHPNKTVVKFHQQGEILSLMTATLRECIPQQANSLPLDSAPSFADTGPQDLPRNREVSYTHHMEELSAEENFSFPSTLTSTSATSLGPFFLYQDGNRTFYVNGKEVLKTWVKLQLEKSAEMLPLLVSHPLRDTLLDAKTVALMQNAGMDLDELEKNFWVVRAIPMWMRGLPLETGLHAILTTLGVRTIRLEDFAYESLSPGKWSEIWEKLPLPTLVEQKLVIEIGPRLFT